jgi:aminoglycoside phosphotransferase (APT) family kinase protein
MMIHWTQANDPPTQFALHSVTTRPGFPARRALVSRYEHLAGRSVQDLDWYVALALWKATVFMEGNYKRAVSGSTDDPYLRSFGEGVVELAQRALRVTENGF